MTTPAPEPVLFTTEEPVPAPAAGEKNHINGVPAPAYVDGVKVVDAQMAPQNVGRTMLLLDNGMRMSGCATCLMVAGHWSEIGSHRRREHPGEPADPNPARNAHRSPPAAAPVTSAPPAPAPPRPQRIRPAKPARTPGETTAEATLAAILPMTIGELLRVGERVARAEDLAEQVDHWRTRALKAERVVQNFQKNLDRAAERLFNTDEGDNQ